VNFDFKHISDSARLDKKGKTHQGRIVYGARCLWGEMSMGRAVRWASCPWGELSMGRAVMGASCHGASSHGASLDGAICLGIENWVVAPATSTLLNNQF
jgi:hypothetical protein